MRKDKKILNQITAIVSVVASVVTIIALYWTFILKENNKISETFIAVILGVVASMLSAFIFKFFTQKKNERIFIIYSHKDKEFADKVKYDLRKSRYIATVDTDVINVGDEINKIVSQAILKSDILLFIISVNSNKSKFVKKEFEKAVSASKKILPIVIDKNSEIPSDISNILYADFTDDYGNALKGLLKGLEKAEKITTAPNNVYNALGSDDEIESKSF